jgi:hypothetical protein
VILFAKLSAIDARGERFLRESFAVPAGVLAMSTVNAASEPELNAAIERIADAVADFIVVVLLEAPTGDGLKLPLRRS